ncbi:hypothetical protein [Fructilactobacillus fructivorans]|uniref:Uncharacterized protein n=1 Tax=Fructilactobacillus fructivorans TaxID=1614 RepID=A0A0C1Q338_9LACO|nr:hypothetical protein [Fructilactobacillus fructivorans]KID42223.1 hypothetical protein LfDm3_0152 [Fructilactobacillus fructivorans]KRK58274.1 hypothetical protein FC73_GL000660 [Fructilactobacillus fructivorans]KRN12883.1 hypothetical protein IV37_GL000512 [Fructilactobacillus fructivorans]KRN40848.1 hypothetical protein IV51_GL001074 [Fructilactobacillus fructivorans]
MAEESKETKALDKISEIMNKLQKTLDKEGTESKEGHKVHSWLEEHRAIHEIKRTLHEVGKFDKFDSAAYDKFMKDYEKVVNDLDDND